MRSNTNPIPKQGESILLLGRPGVGKTTFAVGLPNVCVIDCDNNIDGPLRWLKQNKPEHVVKYDTPSIGDDNKPVQRKEQFKRLIALVNEALLDPAVETIVIDSLTTLTEIFLTEVMRQQGRAMADLSTYTGKERSIDEPMQIQDWGAFLGLLRWFISRIKSCNKRFVLTAHIRVEKDTLTGILQTFIACPGSYAELIAGYFAEVWLMEATTELVGNTRKQLRKVITFPSSVQTQPLGLKSSLGVISGSELTAEKLIELSKK